MNEAADTSTSATPGSEGSAVRRPSPLRTLQVVRVILYIQGAATSFLAVMLLLEAVSRFQHNQQVGVGGYYSVVSGFLTGAGLLIAAPLLLSHRVWVRTLVLVLETLALFHAVINLFYGYVQSIGAIALAGFVVFVLSRGNVRQWYAERTSPSPS